MNEQKAAQALTNLADALYELSEALTEQPALGKGTGAGVAAGAVSPPEAAPADLPPAEDWIEETMAAEERAFDPPILEGSAARCPAHRKPYKEGRYGLFCPEKGIDPAWTNSRGYCTVTPKNVDVYLRAHAVPA